MENTCTGRAWIELSGAALAQNVAALRTRLPEGCRLMPAVKANAYGHGAALIAGELNRLGVDAFCVATAQEGVELRSAGVTGEILVLGYTHPSQFPLLRQYDLIQTAVDVVHAAQLNAFGKPLRVHIAIDTGMHRLGERSEHLSDLQRIFAMEHLNVDGVYTHLCAADGRTPREQAYTQAQAAEFARVVDALEQVGCHCPKRHLLSSYGVLRYPELGGDYARVGIALYGLLSSQTDTAAWGRFLRPVLSLKARVAAVKALYAGESAGYGLQFTAARHMRIAVLTIGYADGLPRNLSDGAGAVLLRGCKAPILGRICMDQTIVDVSAVDGVQTGDTAVIIGRSGAAQIGADEVARQAGTITNELLSRLGPRLPRILC